MLRCFFRLKIKNRKNRIRTCDPLVPNQVLYQAELFSEVIAVFLTNEYYIIKKNGIRKALFKNFLNFLVKCGKTGLESRPLAKLARCPHKT
jgi:hypothetical protein